MNHTQKTYTAEDMLAARLQGRKEAEDCLERRIENICRSNHQLLREIMRLDESEPVAGVVISYKLCEGIVKKLRRSNKFDGHAQLIKTCMYRADRDILKRWSGLLNKVKNDV